MPITIQQFRSGKIIEHIPSGTLMSYESGYVRIDGERYAVSYIDNERFILRHITDFLLSDCELHNINFTQCPHCKKHF